MKAFEDAVSTSDLILFSAGYLAIAVLVMAALLLIIFGPVTVAKYLARRGRAADDQAVNEVALNREMDAFIRSLNEAA